MEFDVNYLVAQAPALLRGLVVTIEVSVISLVFSLIIGFLGAAVRLQKVPIVSHVVTGYIEFIRNTPLLVQIFFIFYGLPVLGLKMNLFWSGVVALTVWAGAFQIENIRGGATAVSKGLKEAGMALGLGNWQFFALVVAPIAIRVSIPSVLNTSISMIKNSALLQTIGLAELTFVAVDRIAMDFRTMEMFSAICVMYLALVLVLSAFASLLSVYFSKPFKV